MIKRLGQTFVNKPTIVEVKESNTSEVHSRGPAINNNRLRKLT